MISFKASKRLRARHPDAALWMRIGYDAVEA